MAGEKIHQPLSGTRLEAENIFSSHLGIFSSLIDIHMLVLDDSCKVSVQYENVNENLKKNVNGNPLMFFFEIFGDVLGLSHLGPKKVNLSGWKKLYIPKVYTLTLFLELKISNFGSK